MKELNILRNDHQKLTCYEKEFKGYLIPKKCPQQTSCAVKA